VPTVVIEILILLTLIIVNGIFAMSEIALVSARETRLSQLADAGSRGARAALELMESPGRFLATIQIGISLIAIVSGAYGKATLSERLEPMIADVPWLAAHSDGAAAAIVVLAITYLSLIVGELAPKEIGLRFSERAAALVALPMKALSVMTAPAVRFLNLSTSGFLRVLGIRPSGEETVTRSEIELLIEDWADDGVISETEETMAIRLLSLAKRDALSVGTPRPRIAWIDVGWSEERIAEAILDTEFDMLPVCDGSLDTPIGVVRSREVLTRLISGHDLNLRELAAEPTFVPAAASALDLLDAFSGGRPHMALLIDPYGTIEGLATPLDVVQAVLGSLANLGPEDSTSIVRRADGTWLVDGMLSIEDFEDAFGIAAPDDIGEDYSTVAGLVIGLAGELPGVGQKVEYQGLTIEVVDMDGRRIDKVLVTVHPAPQYDT